MRIRVSLVKIKLNQSEMCALLRATSTAGRKDVLYAKETPYVTPRSFETEGGNIYLKSDARALNLKQIVNKM